MCVRVCVCACACMNVPEWKCLCACVVYVCATRTAQPSGWQEQEQYASVLKFITQPEPHDQDFGSPPAMST